MNIVSPRQMTDAEITNELSSLRDQERRAPKRTKADRLSLEPLMDRITALALEEGRRWRIASGVPWPEDEVRHA